MTPHHLILLLFLPFLSATSLSIIIPLLPNTPPIYLTHTLSTLTLITSKLDTPPEILITCTSFNFARDDALKDLQIAYPNIIFLFGKKNDNFPKALNRAVATSNGDVLVVMSDRVVVQDLDDLEIVLDLAVDVGVGLVGSKMVFQDRRLYHAGVFFKAAAVSDGDYWGRTFEEKPWLFYRLQGYDYMDSRSMQVLDVDALPRGFFAVEKEKLLSVGGFNEAYEQYFFEADLAMKMREKSLRVVYTPFSVVTFTDYEYASQEYISDCADADYKKDRNYFSDHWNDQVSELIRSRLQVKNVTLTWNTECGTGQVLGFTSEAISFVSSVHDKIRLTVKVTSPNDCKAEISKAGYPLEIQKLFTSLTGLEEINTNEPIILVVHRDPGRYNYFIPSPSSSNAPSLVIGRSMYETDRIPSDWVTPCNNQVDKLWVPSAFNVETFSRAGVTSSLLDILPESVDVMHYDPSLVSPLNSIRTSEDEFIFLTIMKWETRKAWKVLLRAYFDEFRFSEHVKLVVLARLSEQDNVKYEQFVSEYIVENEIPFSALPPVEIVSQFMPYSKLPSLYASADAFLLPSHGEGWGLPLMEAMSMELPTVGTNWSGNTEFMNEENSFLIEIDGLEDAATEGHQWATPSLDSLKSHIKYIYANYERSKEKGKQARTDIIEKYSREATGIRIIEKIMPFVDDLDRYKHERSLRPSSNSYGNYNNNNENNYNNNGNNNRADMRASGKFEDENGDIRVRIKFID